MKKNKALTLAMERFPKGSIARFKCAPTVDHISDGIFKILNPNINGNWGVFSGSGLNCFYYNENGKGDWAEIVKEEQKEIEVKLYSNFNKCTLRTDSIKIENSVGGGSIVITHSDIEDIYHALKQLNS